jgi:tRNA(Ile)-lysidine synthase
VIGHLRFRVAEAVATHGLWSAGARVAVAVSGGADSVALLDLLVATTGLHGGRLRVVTVDHGLRPGSADDAAFVATLAASVGLGCDVLRLDLPEGAGEGRAREARYAALDGLDTDVVALGHHADDQVETAILGVLRGGGTRAFGGMPRRRGRYVRPLLDVPRDALRAWAAHRGLSWREDPTNATLHTLRNVVRLRWLPAVEAARAGAVAAIARGAGHAAEDDAFLDALSAREAVLRGAGLCAAWVASAPSPLVRRALLARDPEAASGRLDALVAAARRGEGRVAIDARRAWVVASGAVFISEI